MKIIRIATAAFVLFLIFIVIRADRGTMPEIILPLYDYPYGDKVGHFLLMGMLSFLVNLNLGDRRVRVATLELLPGSLAVAVIITLEEISQSFFPSRRFDLVDLTCSLLGIVIFGRLAWVISRRMLFYARR